MRKFLHWMPKQWNQSNVNQGCIWIWICMKRKKSRKYSIFDNHQRCVQAFWMHLDDFVTREREIRTRVEKLKSWQCEIHIREALIQLNSITLRIASFICNLTTVSIGQLDMQIENLDSQLCDNDNKFVHESGAEFACLPFWNLWNEVQMLRIRILLDFIGFFAWFISMAPKFHWSV